MFLKRVKERAVYAVERSFYHISIYAVYFLYFFIATYTARKYKKYIVDQEMLKPVFHGKKVAIVGPADTAYKYKNGSLIDDCDIVVRFNNNYLSVDADDSEKTSGIGSKTNIIYHYFKVDKNNPSVMDSEKLKRQGLQHVISILRDKRARQRGHRGIRIFMKKNYDLLKNKFFLLPEETYSRIFDDLGTKPTIGHIGITTILECLPSEVFITGFSFFTTSYAAGYRDYTSRPDQLNRFKSSGTGHDPENELRHFAALIKKTPVKVTLDPYLKDLVEVRVAEG